MSSHCPILRVAAPFRRSTARLNDEPRAVTHQRAAPIDRCSTGLIVAKLVARPNYEELASFYLDVMNRHKFYLKYFQPLLKALESVEPLREEELASLTVERFLGRGERARHNLTGDIAEGRSAEGRRSRRSAKKIRVTHNRPRVKAPIYRGAIKIGTGKG